MSRLLDTIRSIVRETFPGYDYLGPRKYRVVRMNVDRVELQIVNRALGLPDILPIAAWPGMAGAWAKLAPGAEVLVQFIDGDPSQPIVTHFAPKGGAGFVPVDLDIDATGTITVGASADLVEVGSGSETLSVSHAHGRVVRYGDPILFGSGAGTVELPAAGLVARVKA